MNRRGRMGCGGNQESLCTVTVLCLTPVRGARPANNASVANISIFPKFQCRVRLPGFDSFYEGANAINIADLKRIDFGS